MNKMVHSTTMYYHQENSLAAEDFVKRLPPPPKGSGPGEDWVVHWVCSGSEAVDLAILMARTYTNAFDVLAIRNAYHGVECMKLFL